MKTSEKVAFLALLLFFQTSFLKGQNDLFGKQQVISNTMIDACFVSTADLDNDGDLDILAAGHESAKLVWYKNDGCGNFNRGNIITTEAYGIWSACTADIDNDGDLDVFSAAVFAGELAWYENDGKGNFGTKQVIYTNIRGTVFVYAADLDKNGYTDIIAISCFNNKIVWCKNKGNKKFEEKQIFHIKDEKEAINGLNIHDFDNDGDLDIILLTSSNREILWLENYGNSNFSKAKTLLKLDYYCFFFFIVDLNNDNKLDIVTTINTRDKKAVHYYENDGNNNFKQKSKKSVGNDLIAENLCINDFNNDNRLDIMVSLAKNKTIGYYEYQKNKLFEEKQKIKTTENGTIFIETGDLDNDGDLDLLSALFLEGKIAWHENLLYNTTATEQHFLNSTLFPNPVQNELYIETSINSIFDYEIYNILGEMLAKGDLHYFSNTKTIDVKGLEKGIYLLHLRNKDKLEVLKFMK